MTNQFIHLGNHPASQQTGILTLSYSGTLLQVNQEGAFLLGADRRDLISRDFDEFIAPDSEFKWEDLIKQIVATEKGFSGMINILRKGGDSITCLIQGTTTDCNDTIRVISLVIQRMTGYEEHDEEQSAFGRILEESLNEIYLFNADTLYFIEVNKGARMNLGYRMEELREMTPLDLIPECTHERFVSLISPLMKGEEEQIFISSILRKKDGSTYPVEVHLQIIRLGRKRIFLAFILDISKQKKIEADLQESERKYHNLYRYAQVGLFETSLKDATVVACNQQYADLAGFSSIEEAIGKNILQIYVYPEDRDKVAQILRSEGHIDDFIVRFRNLATKKPFWAQFSARYNDDRDVAEGSIIDISPLKESEAALRQSEEKYRLLVEYINEAIVVAQNGRLHMVNPSTVRLFGYTETELLNRPLSEFIHPDDRARVVSTHYHRMEGRDVPQHYPFRIITAEGETKWLDNHSVRFEWEGKPATLNILNDITSLIRNQEALRIQYNLGITLASCHTLHDISRAVLDTVMQLEGINNGALLFIDPESGAVDISESRGIDLSPPEFPGFCSNLYQNDQGLTGRPYYGPVSGDDGQDPPSPALLPLSFASLPILERDGVIAILNASGRSEPEVPKITRQHLETMTTQIRGVIMRVRSEQKLAEREKQYRILAENSSDVIWTMDLSGRFTYISPSVFQLRGYTPEEVMNQKPEEVISPGSRSVVREKIDHQLEQASQEIIPHPALTEVEQPRKNGTTVWTEVVSKVLCDNDGKPVGFIGVSRDISEQRRIREALRDSEELFRIMFDHVPAGIILVDAVTQTIREVNQKALSLSGRSREEVIGHSCHGIICPASGTSCPVLKQEKRFDCSEQVILHADGKEIPVLKSVNRVTLSSQEYILESYSDISDLKRTEQALQEANHKLRLLTGITRHDIFNQLNAISLLLDLAMTTYDQDKSAEYIMNAKLASARIDAITAFTREFEDFGTNLPDWYRISSLINNAILEVPSQGVRIENTIPETLEVYTEPIIRKVLTTLMENAIRHGATITTITFSVSEDEQELIVICEDNGVGIPESDKSSIFEHGFGKNTGIGLFLAREILSITGLSIRETGTEGKGARFEIRVPSFKFRFASE